MLETTYYTTATQHDRCLEALDHRSTRSLQRLGSDGTLRAHEYDNDRSSCKISSSVTPTWPIELYVAGLFTAYEELTALSSVGLLLP